jgi:hypothetical protein
MSEQPSANPTNAVAMVAVVIVFFIPLAGLILGHIALSQISRSGEKGRNLALVATIAGWILSSVLFLVLLGTLAAGSILTGWVWSLFF